MGIEDGYPNASSGYPYGLNPPPYQQITSHPPPYMPQNTYPSYPYTQPTYMAPNYGTVYPNESTVIVQVHGNISIVFAGNNTTKNRI
jgi:hypothetical protein